MVPREVLCWSQFSSSEASHTEKPLFVVTGGGSQRAEIILAEGELGSGDLTTVRKSHPMPSLVPGLKGPSL